MINNEIIVKTKKLIRAGTLTNLRSCYSRYSGDYVARREASDHETKIANLKKRTRNDVWVKDVFALRDTKLSADAVKYFHMSNDLDALVKEAKEIVAKDQANKFDDKVKRLRSVSNTKERLDEAKRLNNEYRQLSSLAQSFSKSYGEIDAIIRNCTQEIDRIEGERKREAAELDSKYTSFDRRLTNEQIIEARRFVQRYKNTSREVIAYCRILNDSKIKAFESGLDANQTDNKNRELAAALDKKIMSILPIKREKAYFDLADAAVSEYSEAPSAVLNYCKEETERTLRKIKADLAREKEYLSCERRIDMLGSVKERSSRWCAMAFGEYEALKQSIKEYRNGQKLTQLYNEALQINADIICEPYVKALLPTSDFKVVLNLDGGLAGFEYRETLYKHIPSFDSKWKSRVKKAKDDALAQAKKQSAEAERLMNRGEYSKAFDLCIEADKYGDSYAAYLLGRLYYNGDGVGQSTCKAIDWCKKAASHNICPAMSLLADIYDDSSKADAFYWRKRAVDNGSDEDRLALAKMYYEGEGTDVSYGMAYQMFNSLANMGEVESNGYLGMMYEKGQYVTQDENLALSYYEKGTSIAWIEKKRNALSDAFKERELDRQISENLAKAKAGDPKAQFFIGVCYFKGYRTTQSYMMAKEWFEKAAAQGYIAAMNYLGDMYYNGLGVAKNEFTARRYYQKAKKG